MTVDLQFSIAAQYRNTRVLWQIALALAWLLFPVSPLAGQQDPGGVAGSPGTDEPAASATEDYSGPAVLSQGNQPAVGGGGQYDTIQPFVNLNRIYGNGLTGGLTNAPNAIQSGVEVGFGLRGTHRWRRVTFQLEYNGSYRDYTGQASDNGLNQLVTATAVSHLKRHLVLSFRQTAGIVRQGIGGLLELPSLDSSSTLPTDEPFSNGLKFFDSRATLTYQKTRRLSFSGSIDGSFLRESTPDVGTNSGIVSADVDYRLSSRATIGLDYSFSHFGYTTFESANVNGASLEYAWRATKSVDVTAQVGMTHSSVVGLAFVPIDPEISAILGTATGIQISYRTINAPQMNFRVTKRWHRASADVGYRKGMSPGNGLVLASTEESMTAGLHYSSGDRWTLSVQGGRTMMDGIAAAGSYTGNMFGASFIRLIRPGLQAVARLDVQPVNYVGSQGLNRTFYRGEVGFIFSGRQMPIALR